MHRRSDEKAVESSLPEDQGHDAHQRVVICIVRRKLAKTRELLRSEGLRKSTSPIFLGEALFGSPGNLHVEKMIFCL